MLNAVKHLRSIYIGIKIGAETLRCAQDDMNFWILCFVVFAEVYVLLRRLEGKPPYEITINLTA